MNHAPPTEAPLRDLRSRPTIGLLTHGAGDPNSQTVWEGVQNAAREHDAHVISFPGKPLCSPHGFEAQANIIYDLVGPENVDGLVIWTGALCHRVDLPVITAFCRRYLPLPIATVGHPLVEVNQVGRLGCARALDPG
jgi:sigma-B regulation protein RsbU (phosphoserine phosphatase)